MFRYLNNILRISILFGVICFAIQTNAFAKTNQSNGLIAYHSYEISKNNNSFNLNDLQKSDFESHTNGLNSYLLSNFSSSYDNLNIVLDKNLSVNSTASDQTLSLTAENQDQNLVLKQSFISDIAFTANSTEVSPVPLPATVILFGSALTGLVSISQWKSRIKRIQLYKPLNVLGIKFQNLNYDRSIALFQEWIISKVPHQVCLANVHTVVSSLMDKDLRNINNNSLSTMDGLPLVWYANMVHDSSKASRVCGPDLMLKCLDEGRKRDWKHFFLGGTDDVLVELVKKMEKRFPGVEIVGCYSPPFRALSDAEDSALVDMINAAKPDFLWVGLGAPKQEKWIAAHLDRINVPVQLGVGAAFNFHSGRIKRAPVWMQKAGLEWLYRVYKEKRLLKRYLKTNSVFLMFFLRDILN